MTEAHTESNVENLEKRFKDGIEVVFIRHAFPFRYGSMIAEENKFYRDQHPDRIKETDKFSKARKTAIESGLVNTDRDDHNLDFIGRQGVATAEVVGEYLKKIGMGGDDIDFVITSNTGRARSTAKRVIPESSFENIDETGRVVTRVERTEIVPVLTRGEDVMDMLSNIQNGFQKILIVGHESGPGVFTRALGVPNFDEEDTFNYCADTAGGYYVKINDTEKGIAWKDLAEWAAGNRVFNEEQDKLPVEEQTPIQRPDNITFEVRKISPDEIYMEAVKVMDALLKDDQLESIPFNARNAEGLDKPDIATLRELTAELLASLENDNSTVLSTVYKKELEYDEQAQRLNGYAQLFIHTKEALSKYQGQLNEETQAAIAELEKFGAAETVVESLSEFTEVGTSKLYQELTNNVSRFEQAGSLRNTVIRGL